VTATDTASPPPTPPPGAAAARSRRKRRAVIAAVVCVLAIVAIIVLAVALSQNVVFFRTVSEAVDNRASEQDDRLRVAGAVVPGTIAETRDGVRFNITDGKATIPIVHEGDAPGLFKDGAPVVCEGRWSKGEAFDSDRILIKHGSEYKPPEVDTTGPRS
jgi:cytochrome c-type biogenesis protein CcmE